VKRLKPPDFLVVVENLEKFFQRDDLKGRRKNGCKVSALLQNSRVLGDEIAATGLSGFGPVGGICRMLVGRRVPLQDPWLPSCVRLAVAGSGLAAC
jgi:hypothetical protein